MDKKAKQNKMKDILSSLATHKNDIKEEQYDKMQSAKTLGKQITQPREVRAEVAVDEVPQEELLEE